MTRYMDGVNGLEILCKKLYILDKLDPKEDSQDTEFLINNIGPFSNNLLDGI